MDKRENPVSDATGKMWQAAKPAIAVASGSIVGEKLTNLIANSLLASQSAMIYEGSRVAIPVAAGTILFTMSKNELVRSHAIGHVLAGVNNLLDWMIPSLGPSRRVGVGQASGGGRQSGQQAAPRAAMPRRRRTRQLPQGSRQPAMNASQGSSSQSDLATGFQDTGQHPSII